LKKSTGLCRATRLERRSRILAVSFLASTYRSGLLALREPSVGWRRNSRIPIFTVLGITLVVGKVLADDYGPSFDEVAQATYGNQALNAYSRLSGPEDWHGNLKYYGPFYSAVAEAVTKLSTFVGSSWLPTSVRHLVNFVSLPIAMASFYFIAQRWTTTAAALIGSLLFATQPLIFGHAFINPKDMPFLAFFLLSVALGMWMADKVDHRGMWFSVDTTDRIATRAQVREATSSRFQGISWRMRAVFLALLLMASAFAVEMLVIQSLLLPRFLDLVRTAHSQSAWAPINSLFSLIAERSSDIPAEAYLSKAAGFYAAIMRPIAAAAFIPALVLLLVMIMPVLRMTRPPGMLKATLLAGVALGLATSIRVVGPYAGILVSALVVYRGRRGSLVSLVIYWLTAGLVAYMTWPYLWGAPFEKFWESFQVMRDFAWEFPVLFRGVLYKGSSLPRYYLPFIFGVQLTVSAIMLAALGLLVAIRQGLRNPSSSVEKLMVSAWILVPLTIAVITAPAFYDNGRQYLFILPPIFLFAALGVGALLTRIRTGAVRAGVLGLILVPGILGIIRLHPYEYVYYNSLVGGVRGAFRQYELDYWTTSYQEALEILNELGAADSSVYIHGPWENVWEFAREDFTLYDPAEGAFDPRAAKYLIVSTRANVDRQFHSKAAVIDAIEVEGATLGFLLERAGTN